MYYTRPGHPFLHYQRTLVHTGAMVPCVCVYVCVYYCRTYYKAVRGGGRRRVEDMCYDIRRAEACVDESAHHALANAGGREIVGKKEGEQKGSAIITAGPITKLFAGGHVCVYYCRTYDKAVCGVGPVRNPVL